MVQSGLFQFEQETPWQDQGNGIMRQVFGYDEKVMLVKAKFNAGAIGEIHQHLHSQVTYVESGVFEIEISGEKKILKAGDAFYAPPNEIHGAVCLEAGVLIDVFSPYREDFVEKKMTDEG